MSVTFSDFDLPAPIRDAIDDLGFVSPTPIQEQAIPALLSGRDVVGIAQTGTGKTAAFGLPLLSSINREDRFVQAIVLAPTRELAGQTASALNSFAHHINFLKIAVVYGGASYGPQIKSLESGAQIVVGTPGRIMDLIEKGHLDLTRVHEFVLDEADEMLAMGFAQDVEEIASSIPRERRTALFSATMPKAIRNVASQHLNNPVEIMVTPAASTVDTVEQSYSVVPYRYKSGALSRILALSDAKAALVFVRTRAACEEVTSELTKEGITAAALSGDVAQRDRERIVERLRSGSLKVLVATDVAARGLDVERIGLVVNFDVPRDNDTYVHRIGRTGRAGRKGESLTFFTPKEMSRLRQIEKATGAEITEISIPTPAQVLHHRAKKMLNEIPARVKTGNLDDYEKQFIDLCVKENLEPAKVAAALLALTLQDDGSEDTSSNAGRKRREEHLDSEGNFVKAEFENGRDRARSRKPDENAVRYRIEVGHKDKIRPSDIVGAITGESSMGGADIGRIDILPTFSLVDIQGGLSSEDLRRVARAKLGGRSLRIRPDTGPTKGGSRTKGNNFSKKRRFK